MSKKHYSDSRCPACGRWISSNGGAYTAHYKMHIRNGEMVRLKNGGYAVPQPNNANVADGQTSARLSEG